MKLADLSKLIEKSKQTKTEEPKQEEQKCESPKKKKKEDKTSRVGGYTTFLNTPKYRQIVYQQVLDPNLFKDQEYLAKRFFSAHLDAPSDHPFSTGYALEDHQYEKAEYKYLHMWAFHLRKRVDGTDKHAEDPCRLE